MSKKLTEKELLFMLSAEAEKSGVNLTYTHRIFFLRLLEYAERNGVEEADGFRVALSVAELSRVLDISLRTTTQSLNRLAACGALQRITERKTYPRSPTVTFIEKKYFVKE